MIPSISCHDTQLLNKMIAEFQLLTLSSVPFMLNHADQNFKDGSLTFECNFFISPVILKDFFQ